jgi:hypothetical protein
VGHVLSVEMKSKRHVKEHFQIQHGLKQGTLEGDLGELEVRGLNRVFKVELRKEKMGKLMSRMSKERA